MVIAEDEALIRLDLKEMLEEEGYAVVAEAGDGESAVTLALEHRPDLVILDVKMPILDGISAAERIVSQRVAPCLILTAFSQRDLVERARDAGAMAYLVKPFTKSDLVPAIEMAVSRHQEMAALEREVGTLSERLETRKLVERAKGLLMERHGWSEPQAFRWIQKASMDRRLSMKQVAQIVVADAATTAAPAAGETGQDAAPGSGAAGAGPAPAGGSGTAAGPGSAAPGPGTAVPGGAGPGAASPDA
ncbi:hypothetical protein GCM10017559_70540 [Streptosporangium longisporum]|uniref:Response regulator n=1 Tax=Streptosporangium longisporum TaxID=46187 RepID=A0ABP6L7Z4_9ACTN